MTDYTCIYTKKKKKITYIIMVPNIYRNQIGLVLRQNYKNKMFFNFPQVSFKKQNFQKFEINELILRLFIVITDCGKKF